MPVAPVIGRSARRRLAVAAALVVLALSLDRAVAFPLAEAGGSGPSVASAVTHLVISEVMTGGASASDEFIELYNPTAGALPLEGLEIVYVTASGATVTRKASWSTGAPGIPAGAHLLIANSGGIFAGVADVAYASGLAATGGSVALRIVGATAGIDTAAWGNATSTWVETQPAPAPPAGSSIERLPGGTAGSGQDTDSNLVDFVVQPVPDPQNSASPPILPGSSPTPTPTASATATPAPSATATATAGETASPTPTATPTATPTPAATATATPSPMPTLAPTQTPTVAPTATPTAAATPMPPISIAAARAMPDGSEVTVEGVTLTDGAFNDGGGYLLDATGGIAVLVSDGTFDRGQHLRVTGTVDDRYAQRTIRTSVALMTVLGAGSEPLPNDATTGSVGEALEGNLVELTGVISSSATVLSAGMAWDVDDGSGPIRVLVATATGIDTSAWGRGVGLTLVGVVGQRDSSGSGSAGYRVQPRDSADIVAIEPAPTATPTPTPAPTLTATPTPQPTATEQPTTRPTPTASSSPDAGVPLVTIAAARAASVGTELRIRGVVTAPLGLLEAGSAVVQDSSGGILVRIGADVGTLALGEYVELDGRRSTKAGMLALRVGIAPLHLGTQAEPEAVRRATGSLSEADEAHLVIARGMVSSAISRTKAGSTSFAIDDGSGSIRVTISSRARIQAGSLRKGAWVEVRGVLGQQTTSKAPLEGYRIWPRVAADVRIIAGPTAAAGQPAMTARPTACCAHVQDGTAPTSVIGATLGDPIADAPGGAIPILERPQPTGSTSPVLTARGHLASETPPAGPPAAGLIVSGMGIASVAGLMVWLGRRRPDDDPPSPAEAEERGEPALPDTPPSGALHLSLVPSDEGATGNERRILPPT